MFTYPKILRRKDLKKIKKYPCDEQFKDAYLSYLTNYSFEEFMEFCKDNESMGLPDLLFKFTDLQLEKFEPNSIIWVSHVLVNFMIYFDVNLDYGEYYDAYVSALQFTVLSSSMKMIIDKIPYEEVPLSEYSKTCFKKLFNKCPDFKFDLVKDCELAYKSFNDDFGFSSEEFYLKVKKFFDDEGY
ncbi:hypothetical protein [uncultured Methanobrevibacter sp.]|uniref:hypothetical protein n=1 Tax=uncultured Methanobrevibacter sp. TaxID=253161 RepID=UPI0025F63C03|nr:hypothetical protein [uncultured Methanobrevibacter sp.]